MQFSLHLLTPRHAFSILEAESVPKYVKHCPNVKFLKKEQISKKGTNENNFVFPFVLFWAYFGMNYSIWGGFDSGLKSSHKLGVWHAAWQSARE